MRRPAASLALAVLAACGGSSARPEPSSTTAPGTVTTLAPVPTCVPASPGAANGTAAVTAAGRVRVWNLPHAGGWVELPVLGDDPNAPPSEGDGSYVESAVAVGESCAVFVGMCCEPVSGLTKWLRTPDAEPVDLFGRLPAVSPDGRRLLLVGYESLTVSPVDTADDTEVTVRLGDPETSTVHEAAWLDDERAVLLLVGGTGSSLQVVDVAAGVASPAVPLTAEVSWTKGSVTGVGLVGMSPEGSLVVRSVAGSRQVIEHRDAGTLAVVSTSDAPAGVESMRLDGDREVRLSSGGTVTVGAGTGSPTVLGEGYTWAG